MEQAVPPHLQPSGIKDSGDDVVVMVGAGIAPILEIRNLFQPSNLHGNRVLNIFTLDPKISHVTGCLLKYMSRVGTGSAYSATDTQRFQPDPLWIQRYLKSFEFDPKIYVTRRNW